MDRSDERDAKKNEGKGGKKMSKAKKAKPQSPKPNVDTYLLAKHSGLFRPGTPLILAYAVPSKKPKEKQK
jgi:hypothetical protein